MANQNVNSLIRNLANELKDTMREPEPDREPLTYEEITRPPTDEEARDAIAACMRQCPGPDKCNSAGAIFAHNYYISCRRYKKWSDNQRTQLAIEKAVPLALVEASFETYEPKTETQEKALAVGKRFLQKEAYMAGKGILFLGPNGIGKTHIAVSIFRELVRLHIPVLFARPKTAGLYQEIEAYYRRLEEPKVLIYDDLGTELRKDFIVDLIFGLLDKRIAEEKSIIATSNLTKAGLRKWVGPRIFSRLSEKNYILEIDGEDHRLAHRDLF